MWEHSFDGPRRLDNNWEELTSSNRFLAAHLTRCCCEVSSRFIPGSATPPHIRHDSLYWPIARYLNTHIHTHYLCKYWYAAQCSLRNNRPARLLVYCLYVRVLPLLQVSCPSSKEGIVWQFTFTVSFCKRKNIPVLSFLCKCFTYLIAKRNTWIILPSLLLANGTNKLLLARQKQ